MLCCQLPWKLQPLKPRTGWATPVCSTYSHFVALVYFTSYQFAKQNELYYNVFRFSSAWVLFEYWTLIFVPKFQFCLLTWTRCRHRVRFRSEVKRLFFWEWNLRRLLECSILCNGTHWTSISETSLVPREPLKLNCQSHTAGFIASFITSSNGSEQCVGTLRYYSAGNWPECWIHGTESSAIVLAMETFPALNRDHCKGNVDTVSITSCWTIKCQIEYLNKSVSPVHPPLMVVSENPARRVSLFVLTSTHRYQVTRYETPIHTSAPWLRSRGSVHKDSMTHYKSITGV